MGRLVLP